MTYGIYALFLCMIGCSACESPNRLSAEKKVQENKINREYIRKKDTSSEQQVMTKKHKTGEFDVFFHGVQLRARVDEQSNIMILNWPKEWHLKSKMMRYVGKNETPSFTPEHCKRVRDLAESFMGREIVPMAYFSDIVFEVLPFFDEEFKAVVGRALEEFGHPKDDMYILNAIDRPNGNFEIDFSEHAISRILNLLTQYWGHYNLQFNSSYDEIGEQRMSIRAGDLLCDLASGDAVMHVTFPIDGERNTIKAIYDPLELLINQQPITMP